MGIESRETRQVDLAFSTKRVSKLVGSRPNFDGPYVVHAGRAREGNSAHAGRLGGNNKNGGGHRQAILSPAVERSAGFKRPSGRRTRADQRRDNHNKYHLGA